MRLSKQYKVQYLDVSAQEFNKIGKVLVELNWGWVTISKTQMVIELFQNEDGITTDLALKLGLEDLECNTDTLIVNKI